MAEYDVNLREHWRIFRKRRFLVVMVAVALGAFSTVFSILRAPTPVYESQCAVRYDKQAALDLLSRRIYLPLGTELQTQISIIKSFPVMERAAEKIGKVRNRDSSKSGIMNPQLVSTLHDLQSKIEVEREENTNIFTISAKDPSAKIPQQLANAVAASYEEYQGEEQVRQSSDALKYIATQLVDARQKLRESEEEFNQYTQNQELVAIDLQGETLVSKSREVKDEIQGLDKAKAELSGLQAQLAGFIKSPAGCRNDHRPLRYHW